MKIHRICAVLQSHVCISKIKDAQNGAKCKKLELLFFRLTLPYYICGGQIENIARKQLVSNILHDTEELDLSLISKACDQELLNRQNGERIRIKGFC